MNSIKTVSVEYIESGTFQAGEEDCGRAGINSEDIIYVVIKEIDYAALQINANKYVKILKVITEDETGDIDFIKHSINKIIEGGE